MTYKLNEFDFNSHQTITFDANIWIYILRDPTYKHDFNRYNAERIKYAKAYSDFYQKLSNQQTGIKLAIFGLTISEIYNRILRNIFITECPGKDNEYYKSVFRNSIEYKEEFENLTKDFELIFSNSFINGSNDKFDLGVMKDLYANKVYGNIDINDYLLFRACKSKNNPISIITHDSDFKVFKDEIDIYTLNRKLLLK